VPKRESAAKNFAVTAAVAVVCSFLVSVTAVGLRDRQARNKDVDRMRHILQVAGIHDPRVSVLRAFERVEERIVDLESGDYVRAASLDPAAHTVIPVDEDVAGIERRERYVHVYLVRDRAGEVDQIVLPVRGRGWSMLHGYVALSKDLVTVHGLTIHRHDETAGMGAQVDRAKWKALWPGKRIYGPDGDVRLRVIKGAAPPDAPYAVDGLTGATLTTEGVSNMIRFWFGEMGYRRFLERRKEKGMGG